MPLGIDIDNDKEVFKNFINAQKLINKENIIQVGIDHEAYGHLSIVSDRVREELAKEFI